MTTNFGQIADGANIKLVSSLPTTPGQYYGTGDRDVINSYWVGGEEVFHTGDNKYYIQTATSGTTAVWKRVVTAFIAYP